jgi:hypothetical protein
MGSLSDIFGDTLKRCEQGSRHSSRRIKFEIEKRPKQTYVHQFGMEEPEHPTIPLRLYSRRDKHQGIGPSVELN